MGGDTDDLDGELISRAVTNVQSRTETCQPFLSRGARLVGIILVNRGKEDRNTL
jgi:16S rRNA G527 N7-methylase RsmG